MTVFRRLFRTGSRGPLRLHISADERYEFYCDGALIGRGPDFGDKENWYFDTYRLDLSPGDHVFAVRVFRLGSRGPFAQISVEHGLIMATDPGSPLHGEVSTGVAAWQALPLPGYSFGEHQWWNQAIGEVVMDTEGFPWDWKLGRGDGWTETIDSAPGLIASLAKGCGPGDHLLKPAVLPSQYAAPIPLPDPVHVCDLGDFASNAVPFAPEKNLAADPAVRPTNGAMRIPARTTRRFLFDLAEYQCFYYRLSVSGCGGGRIRIGTAESLFASPGERYSDSRRANRDQVDNFYWIGLSDTYLLDRGDSRDLESVWWRCGRYVMLVVSTADEPAVVNAVELTETRYPLSLESKFGSSDARLEQLVPMTFRTLQVCCHEIFMDCPYYEQQQWVGDMRVQILCHFTATADSRPAQKALALVAGSRGSSGLTAAYYPSETRSIIPGFSLWYNASVYDLARWRGHPGLVRALMPAVRTNMDAVLSCLTDDGLVAWPHGWNYTDWSAGWPDGVPPAGEDRVESILNLQAVLVLGMMAELETYVGEPEMSARWARRADGLFDRCRKAFWNPARGLFSIDTAQKQFSEHSQCMAVLTGRLTAAEQEKVAAGLLNDTALTRAQIFYGFYLFETFRELGRIDALLGRMGLWTEMKANGFRTTPETYPDPRSDCHAWAAHPLYHYFASILGIRPGSMGFATVDIRPQLGSLAHATGKMVHPLGLIEANFRSDGRTVTGRVCLPRGLSGRITVNGRQTALKEGDQAVG
jgi:hypothetical protein